MNETSAPAAPPAVADYFVRYADLIGVAPIPALPFAVVALFTAGRGWVGLPLKQQVPVTVDWARGAQAAGAVAARVGSNGIYADFQLAELV